MNQTNIFSGPPISEPVAPATGPINLDEIFRHLNQRYFFGAVNSRIRWGRYGHRPRRVRRRTIRLGAYFFETGVIRIHPVLAQEWVPREVLESVVHHEMCHAAAPHVKTRGRRCHHHAEFRSMEKAYEHHAWAETWIKQNIDRLLRQKR